MRNDTTNKLAIYGTLGPACKEVGTLKALFEAGMTGVRLNLSHTDLDDCAQWLENLRAAGKEAGVAPELLIDLKGPELRVDALEVPIPLTEGEEVTIGEGGIPMPPILFTALTPGQEILLDDGAMLLAVCTCNKGSARCLVRRGGTLKGRKSIAAPGAKLHPPTLTESDLRNLQVAKAHGVTAVMLPFVRDKEDILTLRKALEEAGAPDIRILAKLENRAGVHTLPTLLPYADEIIIARGDLGNDMPLWKLPRVQKEIAANCRAAGQPFMVVTQLLHSMQAAAVPTRAEVSDIFNAVLDGAASLMLTGETAVGAYPVEAMRYLCSTAAEALGYLAGQQE